MTPGPAQPRPTANSVALTPKAKVTAKATTGTLAAANPRRICLYVSNPSTKEVWLALGPTAVKEEGIHVRKEGLNSPVRISEYTGVVSCITTAEEGTVTVSEV
jgi:hypothetical protein